MEFKQSANIAIRRVSEDLQFLFAQMSSGDGRYRGAP